jgi:hypothetical protein
MPSKNTAYKPPNRPPISVKLMVVVLSLYGIVRLFSGVFVVLLAVNIGIADDGGAGTRAVVFSLVPIGTAVVTFVLVHGLWNLVRWAWFLGLALAGTQLARGIVSLFGGEFVVYEIVIFASLGALLWTKRRYYLAPSTESSLHM